MINVTTLMTQSTVYGTTVKARYLPITTKYLKTKNILQ